MSKLTHKYDTSLNVFTYGYMPWRYPANWFRNIRNFFRNIKWAWQRATKGYCDWDRWDLDQYYLNVLRLSIREFAEKVHGWPDREFETFEDWQNYLYDIANKLDEACLDSDDVNKFYKDFIHLIMEEPDKRHTPEGEELMQNYYDEELRIHLYQQNLIDEALAAIGKYIHHLWD